MKKILTPFLLLLLCGILATTPALKAEPAKKQSEKASHKQKPAKDDDQDENKPTPKKAPQPKETDSDEDKPAAKKPVKAKDAEKKKDEAAPPSASHPAAVSTINMDDLTGFSEYPKQVRSLVESALALTHLGLTYKFGGSNPSEGGMDCSGTIYHVLKFQGLKDVPRQSDEMCAWVRDHSDLHVTTSAKALGDADFDAMKPGDMLFWTGTYKTDRKLPITHVMLYLGKLKKTGKPVVFGASDGRYYAGERRSGVSVFDLSMPREGSEAILYGYGPVPGLMPAPPREQLAKVEPKKSASVAVTGGETILPAIVVPSRSTSEVADENQRSVTAKIPEAMEKSPPKDDVDNEDEPAVAKTKPGTSRDHETSETKKSVASSKTKSASLKSTDEDGEDKPAVKRKSEAKSSVARKSSPSTADRTAPKKKTQPGTGKVALDETSEALRRAGKSIRSVFE